MSKLRALIGMALCLLPALPVFAHEPLWGESPQTFAFGIYHPEIRFGFENADRLFNGSHTILNPDALRRTRFDTLTALQYAPTTRLNVRLEVPFVQVLTSQRVGGQTLHSGVTGIGDVVLTAKSRFAQSFGEDWKQHQALTVGLKLPTGTHNGRTPDGILLDPSDQPGSGKWGYVLGYAYAYERVTDTFWASAMLRGDFGGIGRRGVLSELDVNYGYWIRRAKKPQDLGMVLAGGLHGEWMTRDLTATGASNTGSSLIGWQASLIATKGQGQFRMGLLVPFDQHVNGTQLRSEIQFRAGLEILL